MANNHASCKTINHLDEMKLRQDKLVAGAMLLGVNKLETFLFIFAMDQVFW